MAHQTALLIVPGTCPDSTTWPPPPVNWRWHTPSFSCHCRERRGQLPKVGGGICKAESVWPPAAAGCPLLCSLLSDWPQHAGYPPMLGHPPRPLQGFCTALFAASSPPRHAHSSLSRSFLEGLSVQPSLVSLFEVACSTNLGPVHPPLCFLCFPCSPCHLILCITRK